MHHHLHVKANSGSHGHSPGRQKYCLHPINTGLKNGYYSKKIHKSGLAATKKAAHCCLGCKLPTEPQPFRAFSPKPALAHPAINNMITIISGTNRQGSNTGKVAAQYLQLLQKKGVDPKFVSLEGLDVSQRNDAIQQLETAILVPSDKFIFIAPEYNGSIPGVLKSLIDHTDIKKVWAGKKALLTGVSTGRAGNLRGMEHLTGILHYVKMHVHPNKLPISLVDKLLNGTDSIQDAGTLKAIEEQLDEFLAY
jgi:chromate reductase, NAD(P)H dehydrogenase (quinone)